MKDLRVGGASIQIRSLRKEYRDQVALESVDLDIQPGEFMTLLGPSGSGKTTTLNAVAGFLIPTSGDIHIDGESVAGIPPWRREIGMVFQNYALFPHMTVAENVAFPLKQRKIPRQQRAELVAQALETVRLTGRGERYPAELSGGQQQRVALARAIVFRPRVLLMDEPLGALDKSLRENMQSELRRIHKEVGSTILLVTHDQEEALALSDRIAVFREGRIDQVGRGKELYARPLTEFVGTFMGDSTRMTGTVQPDGRVDLGGSTIGQLTSAVTGDVTVYVRPDRLRLSGTRGAEVRSVPVTVQDSYFTGVGRRVTFRFADGATGAVVERASESTSFGPGDAAHIEWRDADAMTFNADGAPLV